MAIKNYHFSKSGDIDIQYDWNEETIELNKLCLEVLDECRKSLMMSMRFLRSALWHLSFEPLILLRSMGTDGKNAYYDIEHLINEYRANPDHAIRTFLHMIMHCVFHHPFDVNHEQKSAWDLACDIAVESTVIELCGERFPHEYDEERLEACERLRDIAGSLSAHALYKIFKQGSGGAFAPARHGIDHEEYRYLFEIFTVDTHDPWPRNQEHGPSEAAGDPPPDALRSEEQKIDDDTQSMNSDQQAGGGGGGADSEDEQQQDEQGEAEEADEGAGAGQTSGEESEDEQSSEGGAAPGGGEEEGEDDDEAASELDEDDLKALEEWTEISKSMQVDLESLSNQRGDSASALMDNLTIANRKPADYKSFLKQFAAMGEDMKINDDEFDYIFYTYGLQRYGNMPLVEPLEYKEDKRVREFVIAIDTSGSCSGELVKTFVTRTYDILAQQEGFGDKINIHIIQCDAQIQSDTKITSLREMEEFRDNFKVMGFGGTDFRPVFAYVQKMIEAKEFEDLRGLIYFTDGEGTFPPRAPQGYETAFVFVREMSRFVRIPPWAMKVVMTEEELQQL